MERIHLDLGFHLNLLAIQVLAWEILGWHNFAGKARSVGQCCIWGSHTYWSVLFSPELESQFRACGLGSNMVRHDITGKL